MHVCNYREVQLLCINDVVFAHREYLKRALSIMEKVHGPDHPEIATILCSLGENMINNSTKTNDSVKTLNRAVSIIEPLQRHRREVCVCVYMCVCLYTCVCVCARACVCTLMQIDS